MKASRRMIRRIFDRQISQALQEMYRDPTARPQSELSFAQPGRSKKSLQKSYWGQHRGAGERREIDHQLADMDPLDLDTIGDLVPIGRVAWGKLKKPTEESMREDIPSERSAYLTDLAWDLASGRAHMSDENLFALIDLASPKFEIQLTYAYDEQRVEEDMDDAAHGAVDNLVGNLRHFAKKISDVEVQSVPGYEESASDEDYTNFQAAWAALNDRGFTDLDIHGFIESEEVRTEGISNTAIHNMILEELARALRK